jgi:uncharacterized protein YwgA
MGELNGDDFKAAMAVVKNRLANIEAGQAAMNQSIQSMAESLNHFVTSVETRLAVGSERFKNLTEKIDWQTAELSGKATAQEVKEIKDQMMSKRTAGTIAGGVSAGITFLVEILKAVLGIGAGGGN